MVVLAALAARLRRNKSHYRVLNLLQHPNLAALICWVLVFGIGIITTTDADITADREALMGFMKSADPNGLLLKNWTGNNPCDANWDGVRCNNGRVWHVILESRQLGGQIDANTIGDLDQLRRISLKNNMLHGPMPTFQSPFLRCIWLSNNSFTGSIPDIFGRTAGFHKLDLSYNKLNGEIPASLASLAKLDTLWLDDNQLTGSIPPFNQDSLAYFNVSNNELSGPIPGTYKMQSYFKQDSFMNNANLCGPPLALACPEKKAISTMLKIFLIVAGDILFLCFVSLTVVYCYRKMHKKRKAPTWNGKKEVSNDPAMMSIETGKTYDKASRNEEMTEAEKSKLVVFQRPGRVLFDLEELLRASAEMLGKGSFGTAYKAVFSGPNDHSAVVVKRLRDMQSAGKREFDRQMLILGQLQHPNLAPLLAYYYAKDEKFLVFEYIAHGSLFSLLHGTHGPGRVPLNWDSRLKVARGVARGMAHLHTHLKSQKIPHGNLKSTNILIEEGMVPKVADFGMAPLLTPSGAQCMVAFKAPEYNAKNAITVQADVYSFGIILLELLTGKLPSHFLVQGGEGVDLPKWVGSMVERGTTSEVFDLEVATTAPEGEKEKMLQVAMSCVGGDPKGRPSMQEAAKLVDEIRVVESPTTALVFSSPNSYETDYDTPTHSFDSRRSSFQDLVSPPNPPQQQDPSSFHR